ncbi:tryptophan synthase beta subunit-like PLP-dependent enzyme [Lindgomyces ingoldianus]|uniref:Tryptophan synthase beta subunit-like PLP-dependent enzyme n=1 Tax=Lindgomyces ingoldianus TaxID=673940 RepID=A0ACB6QG60_9PLEO|nr:tryptophan synthase beta subunit-like PLP-dependent enzyme [Lindgomyces ingoldianus]KAF2465963.1 tryptophan synthase beta subunit-like PLP-dependent enzyme [Lindgomyces ingoldianus]
MRRPKMLSTNMSFYELPSGQDVEKAGRLITHKIVETPTKTSKLLSEYASSNLPEPPNDVPLRPSIELYFKCENFQCTGSFKFRGAIHFLAKLEDHELSKGVVAYSTGNHAQAVARAAQLASEERNIPVPAYVVVPENCSSKKIDAAKKYGAKVLISGTSPEARVLLASKVQKSTGATLVPPADHLNIALGQATLVGEFLRQVTDMGHSPLDAVIVPSGGGGLLVGAAAVCKPQGVAVFGAEPEKGGAGLAEGLRKGARNVGMGQGPTIADGLRSLTGEANWELIKCRENVDLVFTATESQIREALRLAIDTFGFIIEPSAAVPLAVALFNTTFHQRIAKERRLVRVGVVFTGCNISEEELLTVLPGVSIVGVQNLERESSL